MEEAEIGREVVDGRGSLCIEVGDVVDDVSGVSFNDY